MVSSIPETQIPKARLPPSVSRSLDTARPCPAAPALTPNAPRFGQRVPAYRSISAGPSRRLVALLSSNSDRVHPGDSPRQAGKFDTIWQCARHRLLECLGRGQRGQGDGGVGDGDTFAKDAGYLIRGAALAEIWAALFQKPSTYHWQVQAEQPQIVLGYERDNPSSLCRGIVVVVATRFTPFSKICSASISALPPSADILTLYVNSLQFRRMFACLTIMTRISGMSGNLASDFSLISRAHIRRSDLKNLETIMKNLMLTTAVLAAFSGAAYAQDATTPGMFRPAGDAMELRVSSFIGMRVYARETAADAAEYNGMQQDWSDIGEVNDVILSRNGTVDAVLVDIGGFLGMGERQIAVAMSAIQFVGDSSTADVPEDFFLVMTAARADLEAAPDYTVNNAVPATGEVVADPAAVAGANETLGEPIARDGYLAAEADYLTAEKLTGSKVYDANDEVIGEVGSLVLADDGQVTQAIIDVGGFLGMGEKPVALALTDITILRNEAGDDVRVYLTKTKAELEAMPAFSG